MIRRIKKKYQMEASNKIKEKKERKKEVKEEVEIKDEKIKIE